MHKGITKQLRVIKPTKENRRCSLPVFKLQIVPSFPAERTSFPKSTQVDVYFRRSGEPFIHKLLKTPILEKGTSILRII